WAMALQPGAIVRCGHTLKSLTPIQIWPALPASVLEGAVDRAYEVPDRPLVNTKLCIVVGVRFRSDDLILGLSSGLQFLNPIAGFDQHLAIVPQHRLSPDRPVARHNLGVLINKREQFVGTADLPVDGAAIEIVDVRIAVQEDEITRSQHVGLRKV